MFMIINAYNLANNIIIIYRMKTKFVLNIAKVVFGHI